jgi:hypothetical protein
VRKAFAGFMAAAVATALIGLMLCAGIGFCIAALYLWLAGLLATPAAAAVTGGTVLALVILTLAPIRLGMQRSSSARDEGRPRRRRGSAADLESVVTAAITRWIASNSKTATLTALLGGVAAGASPELRRIIKRVLRELGPD